MTLSGRSCGVDVAFIDNVKDKLSWTAGSKRVVSLSRDDTVQIWQYDGKTKLDSKVSMRHYNNTGRWVLPFR